MDWKFFLSKLLSLLKAKTKIGGLEISDTDLRFACFDGDSLLTAALRLPPGIIEDGDIANYDMFVEALKNLRDSIPEKFGSKKTVNVMVTLGSVHVYTQVFSLPIIKDENLKEAIQLNVNMVSPFDLSQAYAGWQLINHNESDLKLEVLSAFTQKAFVDRLRSALAEAGFFAVAVESGTLSLVRLARERGADFQKEKPLLILSVDDKGMRFVIVRLGHLHFEYFQSWKDTRGDGKEISWEDFQEALKRNMHQVLNFYGSHWEEPLTDVAIASNSMVEEISKSVKDNFSLNTKELKLRTNQSLSREWYEAAGAAIRGEVPRVDDEDINLFGITAQEEFRNRETVDFIKFWEVATYSSLGILAFIFMAGFLFLGRIEKSVEAQSSFRLSVEQRKEIAAAENEISDFNKSVVLLSSAQKLVKSKTRILDKLTSLMNKNSVAADRIYFQSAGLPVILSGETNSQDNILAFKNELTKDADFSSVNLNLSDIKPQENGFYFTVSFTVK